MWPDTGSALTYQQVCGCQCLRCRNLTDFHCSQVVQDVKVLLDVNANYVRYVCARQVLAATNGISSVVVDLLSGAHYPQDQRFLDLCDEHGIAVWEETLGPGTTVADLTNPYFMKYQIEAVNEMIDASVNHPCVILHAFCKCGWHGNVDEVDYASCCR